MFWQNQTFYLQSTKDFHSHFQSESSPFWTAHHNVYHSLSIFLTHPHQSAPAFLEGMVQDQGRACTFEFMCVWVAGLVSEWNSMGEEGEEEGGNE